MNTAEKLIACEQWRWEQGMVGVIPWRGTSIVITGTYGPLRYLSTSRGWCGSENVPDGLVPDLDHPATIGWLRSKCDEFFTPESLYRQWSKESK